MRGAGKREITNIRYVGTKRQRKGGAGTAKLRGTGKRAIANVRYIGAKQARKKRRWNGQVEGCGGKGRLKQLIHCLIFFCVSFFFRLSI
jgi:molybdenum-dependent DNA-binding transcriptional regulator ModE